MKQFRISHPGEIIARELADTGMSIRRFATELGVTPVTLVRFLAGEIGMTPPLAIRIAAVLGSTPEFWLRLQRNYNERREEEPSLT